MKRAERRNFLKVGVLALGAAASSASGANWFVDDSAPSSGQTGTSWDHPFQTIQQAVSNAANGDEIRAGQGTYKPSSQSTSIDLADQVRIKGGYAGYGASNPNLRDPSTYVTTLSGDLGGGAHAYHVVKAGSTVTAPSGTLYEDKANLDGFTITGGAATGTGTNQNAGGGIFIDQGHPAIRNCTITSNSASFGGGGIYCLNTATAPEIRKCRITANSVTGSDTDAGGGGIGGNYSLAVINTLFQANYALVEGGGLNVDINDELFDSVEATVTIINCQFVDNEVTHYGAGVYVFVGGTLSLTNCLFNDNRATSTSASDGGGMWTAGPAIQATNCTFAHCSVVQGAGGGWADYGLVASTVSNCIFFDNDAPSDKDLNDTITSLDVTYCATEQGISGTGNITLSTSNPPQFVDNSQSNPINNDYHLACGSICIDAGTNAAVPVDSDNADEDSSTSEGTPALEYNLASSDRIIGSTQIVDMGAFERTIQYPCSSPPTGDCAPLPCTDGLVNVDDLLMVVNSWGACPSGQSFCPGDVTATYGSVDVDDLLAAINHWSAHCVFETYAAGSLSSVGDCMEAASEEYEANTPDWNDFVNKCVAGLCAAHVIDCDD